MSGVIGVASERKFGYNPDVDAGSTPEDIWDGGGVYTFASVAAASTIQSSDVDDADGDSGARTVEVYGLDADYLMRNEIATMDGQTPVALKYEYLRVFRAVVRAAGASEGNEGTITVKIGVGTGAIITPAAGQTLMAIYTIPADYGYAQWLGWEASIGRVQATTALLAFQVKPFGEAWQTKDIRAINSQGGGFEINPAVPLKIPSKADIRVRAAECSANDTGISAAFDLSFASN